MTESTGEPEHDDEQPNGDETGVFPPAPDLAVGDGEVGRTRRQRFRDGQGNQRSIPPQLSERFQDIGWIGEGGEAAVWLVRPIDEPTSRLALKIYRPNEPFDQSLRERLRSTPEFSRYAPHLYDFGTAPNRDGDPCGWEAMEYFPEGSLETLMRRTPPGKGYSLELLRVFLEELNDALVFWENTIQLRQLDFSPTNILVRDPNKPEFVLADFGGVRGTGISQRFASSVFAKTMYMAPEQWVLRQYAVTPYWSLGAIFLQLLNGSLRTGPFGSEVEQTQIGEFVFGGDPNVSSVADGYWRRLTAGLLTKNPSDRWGPEQVSSWLAGRGNQIPVRNYHLDRPFVFLGAEYQHPAALAHGMSQAWDEAISEIVAVRLDELEYWLQAHGPRQNIADAIDACRAGRLHADRLLANLLVALAPEAVPSFAGHSMARDHLTVLAHDAMAGDDDTQTIIDRLLESRALSVYTRIAGCEDYAVIDDRWHRAHLAMAEMAAGLLDTSDVLRKRLRPSRADRAGLLHYILQDDPAPIPPSQGQPLKYAPRWFRQISSLPVTEDTRSAVSLIFFKAETLARAEESALFGAAERALGAGDFVGSYTRGRRELTSAISRLSASRSMNGLEVEQLREGQDAVELVLSINTLGARLVGVLRTLSAQADLEAQALADKYSKPRPRIPEVGAAPQPPYIAAPTRPAPSKAAQAVRNQRSWGLIGAVAAPILFTLGAATYKPTQGSEGLSLIIGLAFLIACAIAWFGLFGSKIGDPIGEEKAALQTYDRSLAQYRAAQAAYHRSREEWERRTAEYTAQVDKEEAQEAKSASEVEELRSLHRNLSGIAKHLDRMRHLAQVQEVVKRAALFEIGSNRES